MSRCAWTWVGVMALLATGAHGQMQGAHGLGAGPRPLHLRMNDARAAALVEIREVGPGRIRVVRVAGLRGETPESFEIKRAPSRPPAVGEGDWVLALMRGARSPFVLTDDKGELSVIDEADRAVWLAELPAYTAELASMESGDARGRAILDRYERWLDAGPESLRKLGLRGLLDPTAPFMPLDEAFAARRVATALDSSADPQARVGSAFAASLAPTGSALLLASLDEDTTVEPAVVVVALQGGLRTGSAETAPALARLLGHRDPQVRARTLEMATAVDREQRIRPRVEALAAHDPDAEVRRSAQSALRRYGPARPQ